MEPNQTSNLKSQISNPFFMKHFILLSVSSMLNCLVFAQQKKTAAAKPKTAAAKTVTANQAAPLLKTSLDSLSYAIGVLDGNFFKMQGVNSCNQNLVGYGFNDALNNKSLLTTQQADQVVRKELQKLIHKKIQPNIDEGNKFLAENKKRKEVQVTASGLQYEVLQQGTGGKPADTSVVKVHYEGFLLNGKKFDSSRDRGEPASFSLNQVIPGWTEGVQLMQIGSKYKFYIPYQLCYGEQGAGESIPGGSALVFEVELLEIVK